jgi:LacI family transcriptional regulator
MRKNKSKRRKGKFPSIDDVARDARVSIATVSRVINNLGSVKEANRARVLEVISKLNYKPNISASRLASNKVDSIGLIWPFYDDMFGSFFFTELMKGVRDAVFPEHRELILLYPANEPPDEFYRRILNKTYIGGLMLELGAQEVNPILKKSDIPYIVLNAYYEDPKINCIFVSNKQGAYKAVEYLVKLGHKRIATIHGSLNIQPGVDRLEGYKAALKDHGLPLKEEWITDGNFYRKIAYEKTVRLLELDELPTAVFVASDEMALGAAKAIREKGLEIPRDISIIGFDDNPICTELFPQITTVRQPISEMGRFAAESMIKLIEGKEKGGIKKSLDTELVIRDSCRPVS